MLVKDPVYLQLNKALRDLIRTGRVALGDRFLTERQISAEFGVSRATANKALSNLVAEGLLEFRKGLGTFLRRHPLDYDLQSLVSFTGKARAAGMRPSTRLLRFETLDAPGLPPRVHRELGAPTDGAVYHIERLRLADGAPVILERRYVLQRYCPALAPDDLLGSLYDLWVEKYHLSIAGAEQTIHAVNLGDEEARLLEVPGRSAALLIVCLGYLQPRQPLWWEQTLYRADAYEFRNALGPIRPAAPAAGVLRSGKQQERETGNPEA